MKRNIYTIHTQRRLLLLLCSVILVALCWFVTRQMNTAKDIANLKVRSNDGKVTVNWDAPSAQRNAKTTLTIESADGRKEIPLNPYVNTYHFDEGTHGTLYTFTLQRTDADGNVGEAQTAQALFLDWKQLPELPVISIETVTGELPGYTAVKAQGDLLGETITDNEFVRSLFSISENGRTLGSYHGKIRVRGNTSALDSDKKPYKIVLDKPNNLLFNKDTSCAHSEWILVSNRYLLETEVGLYTARQCGMEWVPQYMPVNVMINGDWAGSYLLMETVVDENMHMDVSNTGFLIEADPYFWNADGVYFQTDYLPHRFGYTFKYPNDVLQGDQVFEDIKNYIIEYEKALVSEGDQYKQYIDVDSYIRWNLTHNLLGTLDAAGSNVFLYKADLDMANPYKSKMKIGPVWDFDWIFSTEDAWANNHWSSTSHHDILFQKGEFVSLYKDTWRQISPQITANIHAFLEAYITAHGQALQESWELEAARYALPCGSVYGSNAAVGAWFNHRVEWLNEAIAGM